MGRCGGLRAAGSRRAAHDHPRRTHPSRIDSHLPRQEHHGHRRGGGAQLPGQGVRLSSGATLQPESARDDPAQAHPGAAGRGRSGVTRASGVRGVLVTHGQLGAELLRTAESILGPQPRVRFLSNAGLSAQDLATRLDEALAGAGPVVLFVDLGGGSCGHICAVARRDHPKVLVARGVNLPMLLEFLHHRDRVPLSELKARLRSKGREGIDCVGWDAADEACR
ncbi:MAG: hypothetical protein GF330_08385 [Candidatus Eisenbacteria bacterium]|nr:hypothetical protein [Candidatus Eisenbacteria bacterium]